MRVLVTGATGVLGRRVVTLLTAGGHTVTAAVRSEAKAERLRASGANIALAKGFDRIAALVSGHDAVCNLATSIPPSSKAFSLKAWHENDRIRTQLSAAIVDAALRSECARVVQESIALVYAEAGDQWITEESPIDPPLHTQSALIAESHAARFTGAGRVGVVLRFGLFYGGDSPHTRDALRFARGGIAATFGSKRDYFPALHLDDAAAAVVAALGVPAGIYNVTDDAPVTRAEYAELLGRAVGRRRPPRVPGKWITWLAGPVARALTLSHRVSNAKLRAASSWRPRYPSVEAGLQAR